MATRDEMANSFGAAAAAYEQGRPDYPVEAVAWLLEPAGAHPRIVDIGAGTGKLTRVVAELVAGAGAEGRGAEVIAVDPDAEMLGELRRSLPGIRTLIGTAEALGLPDESVDAAVLGQVWHWVDPVAGSAEIGRVLKPGGVLGLVWNIRDESVPWVARLTEIMKGSNAEQLMADGGPEVAAPFGALTARTWQWERPMTRAALTAMVHSRSYVITAEPAERERIDREIAGLFDEIGAVGDARVRLPYVTYAFRAVKA